MGLTHRKTSGAYPAPCSLGRCHDDLCSNSVSACVGLGHKYEINYVVRRGGNDLKKFFVENLDMCARVDPPRPPAFKGSIPSVR
ncbi:hypothetical protein BD311DRAFT_377780 [Dichomitus squalens]|uniref:Uncharacterized protein n=1 Tax=Dichomitus squalens TaxID=114155 RepID=A0A4Q9MJ94_9APHY|nr:hypothetical protein BD311DRAFT_377780 [Dichomitus squalens]